MAEFQSRAGFSLRRDLARLFSSLNFDLFQSRAGFSLRRDGRIRRTATSKPCFNPVLGFLFVATSIVRGITSTA